MRVSLLLILSIVATANRGIATAQLLQTSNAFPAGVSVVTAKTSDELRGGPCAVSSDGFVWYALPRGMIAPIDFTEVRCDSAAIIDALPIPQIPSWAKTPKTTQAIFVATSLQEAYSLSGMRSIARDAENAKIPVTWMIGAFDYINKDAAYYNQLHNAFGDDVELANNAALYALASKALPWYNPAVSVEGAGHERQIAVAQSRGDSGFWGITWNSHGTDRTSDEGSPWGSYCADPISYKRPSPSGDCSLVAFEWTARDLTRAFFADTSSHGYSAEAVFSSDPEDVLQRGDFEDGSAIPYEKALVDAYAAGGEVQPSIMMSQQESLDEETYKAVDDPVLESIYGEVRRDGMKAMTLRDALPVARSFSGSPRAIAFPYIPGGTVTAYDGAQFTPSTIDFHDSSAGMTFISGHTMPSRLYRYSDDPFSRFDQPLQETLPSDPTFPHLLGVASADQSITFEFDAPLATHFGVALWTDPTAFGLSGSNFVSAGHAGLVVYFDLPEGRSMQSVMCSSCSSTTLQYSK